MSQSSVPESGHSAYWAATRQPEWPAILLYCAHATQIWGDRRRQRRALAALNDHLLRDVGLTREQAEREIVKPFWKL